MMTEINDLENRRKEITKFLDLYVESRSHKKKDVDKLIVVYRHKFLGDSNSRCVNL